ncbi:hypothetical protein U2A4042220012 [Corynebacterium striatum]|nr:hypothetical protein U2A4042220012 [Corynebacterium striatum]
MFSTWLYSALGPTPISRAIRAIVSFSYPCLSIIFRAASAIFSRVTSAFDGRPLAREKFMTLTPIQTHTEPCTVTRNTK